MFGRVAHKWRMAAVLPALGAVLIAGHGSAAASVLRLPGRTAGPPVWSGSTALVATGTGKETAIELVGSQPGERRQIADLGRGYAEARGMALGAGFVLELIAPNYGGSKYEPGYIGEHELLSAQSASPLSCLARLFSTGCPLPRL